MFFCVFLLLKKCQFMLPFPVLQYIMTTWHIVINLFQYRILVLLIYTILPKITNLTILEYFCIPVLCTILVYQYCHRQVQEILQWYIESCKMLFTWKKKSMFKKKGGGSCPQVPVTVCWLLYSNSLNLLSSFNDAVIMADSTSNFHQWANNSYPNTWATLYATR
jgi:hypothetical protein